MSVRLLASETFAVAKPKTKDFVKLLGGISPEPKILIIAKDFDDNTRMAARNVQPACLVSGSDVNSEHLLAFKKIVVTSEALAQLAERINK